MSCPSRDTLFQKQPIGCFDEDGIVITGRHFSGFNTLTGVAYCVAFYVIGCASLFAQVPAARSPLPIGNIEIVNHEVFDEPDDGIAMPYRIANKIHVQTRNVVVERELLFKTGDTLDRELIEQTERNLRALTFLRDAQVETIEADGDGDGRPDRVDVRVSTWDRWSLSPRVDFQQVHDRTIWEAGVSEKNLFGLGKAITVTHRTNLDRTSDRVTYLDPQLVGSRVSMVASGSKLSDGDEVLLLLNRNYLSLRDPWSWTAGGGSFSRTDPIFHDGLETNRIRHRGQWADLAVGRAIYQSEQRAVRLHGAYRLREERVGAEGRDFGIAEVGLRSVSHRFVRLTHVSQFERNEDFNLGADSFATIGLSTKALGGGVNRAAFVAVGHVQGIPLGMGHFVIAEGRFDGRYERGEWRNALTTFRARYLRKHATRHAFVSRIAYQRGRNLDPEIQLLLGVENGLRGYPVRQFDGNQLLLLSAEERWFVADDVGQLFSLGVAGFIDSGFVWSEEQSFDFGDLKTAVGVSLLLGSNRLSSRGGIRVDVGYGLNRLEGVGRWVFAAGSDIGF